MGIIKILVMVTWPKVLFSFLNAQKIIINHKFLSAVSSAVTASLHSFSIMRVPDKDEELKTRACQGSSLLLSQLPQSSKCFSSDNLSILACSQGTLFLTSQFTAQNIAKMYSRIQFSTINICSTSIRSFKLTVTA